MDRAFLDYTEWQSTADTLHMLLQIVGKVKLARCDQRPEWAHARLYLTVDGMTTGIIPGDNSSFLELIVNFRKHHIEVRNNKYEYVKIPLKNGVTIAEYFKQIVEALKFIGSPTELNVRSQEFYDPVELDKDDKHRHYDEKAVVLFLENLLFAYKATSKFVSPFRGKIDFPAYYFGTMDLSAIVFSGEPAPFANKGKISYHAFDERNLEVGFWPGDPRATKPSFYAMPYPFLSSLKGHEGMIHPAKAVFVPEKKEFFFTLEDALSYDDPVEAVNTFYKSCFNIVQKIKRWDNLDWIIKPLEYSE